jgi:hypothetical protein
VLAVYAAQQAASIKQFRVLRISFTRSGAGADVGKSRRTHNSRRMMASASPKVGNGFGYQLAERGVGICVAWRSWAHRAIREPE